MAGYSGTPLWKKLGLKPGLAASVHQPPVEYFHWLDSGPEVDWIDELDPSRPFIHVFDTSRDELAAILADVRKKMPPDGMVWASWPKKVSKIPTDVTEDVIREIALPLGLVDVKVCAVSDVWSGLKLVIRKELR